MNNDWVTDRKPTAEDSDRYGYVWCTNTESEVYITHWDEFSFDTSLAWQPRFLPLPYVPPKPERVFYNDALGVPFAEVLPGDPPDWDEFLEAVDALLTRLNKDGLETNRVRKARGGG